MSFDSIRDLMRTEVATARPDTTVRDVARQMRDQRVGSIVVEEDRRPVGIVTDRDLAMRVLADETTDPDAHVRAVMTGDPVTVTDDQGIHETARTMREHSVRRITVTDGAGMLAGIVTLDDVYRHLVEEQDLLTDVVEAESPESIH